MILKNIKVNDQFIYNGQIQEQGSSAKMFIEYANKTLYVTSLKDSKIWFNDKPTILERRDRYFKLDELSYLTFKPTCKTILPLP